MSDYKTLRQQWITHLDENGELGRLSDEKRRMLERGSLQVLLSTQLADLERQRRRTRCFVWLAGSVLALACSNAIASLLLGFDWLEESPLAAGPAVAGLLLLSVIAAGVHVVVTRRVERRKGLYTRLGELTLLLRSLLHR